MEDVTQLAAIVAFEHHIKFDASGYPALKTDGNSQHLCSQMVAISDYFDALRSRRPYRKALDIKDSTGFNEERAGRHFQSVPAG
jgi:response regulator RpfG family c-di-GMP phosphodiesterase